MNLRSNLRLALAGLFLVLSSAVAFAVPPGFQQEVVLSGRVQPVFLTVLPDGRMLLLHKRGQITIFDPSVQPTTTQTYMTIPVTEIEIANERGLTSMALDPDFENNNYIYVYYTHEPTLQNRIERFTHQGDTADFSSRVLIWEDSEDALLCCHFGGGIGFGPDDKLYLMIGDKWAAANSQDLSKAGGKIIRINKDGTIPADNPFVNEPGALDEVWAYGLRNPYRGFWDLPANRLIIGDVGGNVQETAREEINIGVAGANYGWPNCEGQCADPNVEDPIFDYGHTQATPAGGAIAAGFIYRGNQYPAAYVEELFYSDYALGTISTLTINPNGTVTNQPVEFDNGVGAPVHLVQGADGALYYVDFGTGSTQTPDGRVLRYAFSSGNQAPEIQTATATPMQGEAPLSVDFAVTASDFENDSLTYRWVFGDGAESTQQNPTHQYAATGLYFAFVEVSDGARSAFSAQLRIQVGNVPVVSIDAPLDGALFRAGDNIMFSGSAVDPDETIPASNYIWDIRFFHNAHTHPAVSGFVGTSGVLTVETSGHDWHDDTGYELTLSVTDSDGLSGTDTIRVRPDKVDVTFATVPAGIPIFVDGIALGTPIVYDTLINFEHTISAPSSYCLNEENYIFESWSNGGAATQDYTVPASDQSLTATYTSVGACQDQPPQNGLVFRVEADSGVTTSGSTVTAWNDQSGLGNDLTAAGNPQLLPAAINGRPAVDFDGSGDKAERTATLGGFAAGNSDRTMYAVLRYDSTGFGGVAYGNDSCNETFGLIVAPTGRLMVQGWCDDFDSGDAGTGQGWMVQSAVYQAGQLNHFQNGTLIDTRTHAFNTVLTRLVLGAELDSNPFMDMQIAAVFIYNRALTPAEQQELQSYLQVKYFNAADLEITSPVEGSIVGFGDVTVEYSIAGGVFDHMHLTLDAAAPIEVTSLTGSHVLNNVGVGAHTLTATLVDAAHQPIGGANSQDVVNFSASDCVPDNFAPGCTVDTDGDGEPDSVEGPTADADGDGIPDYQESSVTDTDGDGVANESDPANNDPCVPSVFSAGCGTDTDGDGTPDSVEGETTDTDGDGVPDYLDSSKADADGDGTTDQNDPADADPCLPSGFGAGCTTVDTDGDGTPDSVEGETTDTDGDGVPDYLESSVEDADGDGTPDDLDADDANACVPDMNASGCGVDSDGDGIADVIEVGPNSLDPLDTDNDGMPDFLDIDSDNDGIGDAFESQTAVTFADADTDGDGIDDAIDVDETGGTDANGNGIDDAMEPVDSDGDGIADYRDVDSDNDGILDYFEGSQDPTVAPQDTDGDGVPDYLDFDSDQDGIPDSMENDRLVVIAFADTDGDGIDDALDVDQTLGTDANGNGIDDSVEPNDTDGDGAPDFRDLDSDNDTVWDTLEAGAPDSDEDAIVDVDDFVLAAAPDTDGDTTPDFRDLDSDGDGTFDIAGHPNAATVDANNDGTVDNNADSDADGIADVVDTAVGTYGSAAAPPPPPPPPPPRPSGGGGGGSLELVGLLLLLTALTLRRRPHKFRLRSSL